MSSLYPSIEPYNHGWLNVGDGQSIYWETCGNSDGKPALVLHGGPGSGATPYWRRFFDPSRYRVVLFDQRGCGRSTPHVSDPTVSLETNATWHLVKDIEKLREHLGIERWLVFGGSWGVTLGLAYAESHVSRVSEAIFFSITAGTTREVDWITRLAGRFFPDAWSQFRDGVPKNDRDGNLADAYARLLEDPDPGVRDAAAQNWCNWEEAHVTVHPNQKSSSRYDEPRFRMAFARLVTHYWRNFCWTDDDKLIRGANVLAGIPAILVHGRLDVSSPPDIAWELAHAWPGSELILLDDTGHGAGETQMANVLVKATDRFADQ